MTITDIVKDSLKLPLLNKTNVLILGLFYTILSLIGLYITFTLSKPIYDYDFKNLAVSTNVSDFNTASNLILSNISSDTWLFIFLLLIVSIFIIIFLAGYHFRIISVGVNEEFLMPSFSKPLSLLFNGLKFLIVSFIYLLIPFLLVLSSFILQNSLGSLLSTFGFILSIISVLIFIMAVNNMVANENKLSYAFKFREILDLIGEVYWIRYIGGLFMVVLVTLLVSLTAYMVLGIIISTIILLTKEVLLVLVYLSIISLFIKPVLSVFISYFSGCLYNAKVIDEFDDFEDFNDDFIFID